MLNYLFGSKLFVNDKVLEKNNINIINIKDIKINKNQIIALTASGKFYNATYKNEAVSVKIIDISKHDSIVNEFVYWQEYKSYDGFLKLYGVCISGYEAYLVFEFFAFTLENALKNKVLKQEFLPKIVKQILNILAIFQKQKKMIKDFRPGVLGIAEGFKVKLLDFGFLISEKPNNFQLIEKDRNKYRSFESYIYLSEDLSYDIWSFGCILIDLFSKKDPLYKLNSTEEEIRRMHEIEAFPIITDEITGFLKEIILKCIERIPDRRIKIDELNETLSIFLKNVTDKSNEKFKKEISEQNNEIKNSILKEHMNFCFDAERKFEKMTNRINNDINDQNILMKNNVEAIHDECITKISENCTQIKHILSEAITYKIEASDKINDKLRERILNFQQKTATLLYEINENTNTINDMKTSIINLNSMSNPEKFTQLIESIKNNRKSIDGFIKSYSNEKDFDEIDNLYKENIDIIQEYKELSENYELLLMDILEVMKKHNEKFCKNSNIKRISKKLDVIINLHDDVEDNNDILDFYAKIQENSNYLIIFNFKTKKFYQISTDFFFPNKSASYFAQSTKEKNYYNFSIYLSGGCIRNKEYQFDFISEEDKVDASYKRKFISLKEFYEIQICYHSLDDKFTYKINQLENMIEGRHSHAVIMDRNFLFAISGQNTKTCEIFNFKNNQWKILPDIPTLCLNSSLAIVNNFLYCISGSATINSFDVIYRISLNNIEGYLNEQKGFEDFLSWNQIDYHFSSKNFILKKAIPRLRKGMGTLNLGGSSIYLFGGFDNDKIYDDIFEIFLDYKENQKANYNEMIEDLNLESNSKYNRDIATNPNFHSSKILVEQSNKENYSKENILKNDNCVSFNNLTQISNKNLFDKSDKAIEEDFINNQIILTNEKDEEGKKEEEFLDENLSGKSDVLNEIYFVNGKEQDFFCGLKIEKKLTTLPNKTFFASNPILIGNTILFIDGYNNAIEYDVTNNNFYYYT